MTLLLSSITLQHFFYEGYAQTQAVLELGSYPYYALLSGVHERDYLLGRRTALGEAYLAKGWLRGRDTVWLGLKTSGRKEAEAAEEGLGLVNRLVRASGGFRLEHYLLLEQRGYYSPGRFEDNSGFREELRLSARRLDGFLAAELRPLNREAELRLSPRLSAGPLSLLPSLDVGKKGYETVRGFEDKDYYQVSAKANLGLGPLSLKPELSRFWQAYQVNSQNSLAGYSASARANLDLGWFTGELARGFGVGDYFSNPSDYLANWAELGVGLRRRGASFRARLRRSWFDYPEGAVPDARDDRTLTTELSLTPWAFLTWGLRARFRDLVFVDARRSQESRSLKRFSAFTVVRGEGFEYRAELSATYSLPWFSSEGTLQRAWDNSVRLRGEGKAFQLRLRLQDYGDFAEGVYYRSRRFAEIWVLPKKRLWRGFWPVGRYYWREDLTEEGLGAAARGEGWTARALLVKRTGEELKLDLSLSWSY